MKHDTTWVSPNFLMFGRHPHIAVDLALGCCPVKDDSGYVHELQERLKKAYELAELNSRASQKSQKKAQSSEHSSAPFALPGR